MSRRVDIRIDDSYRSAVSRVWLRRVAQRALAAAGAGGDVEIGLAITDDETLQRLNRDYRGLDEVTDVLAFSSVHPGHYEGKEEPPAASNGTFPFPTLPGAEENLGDVIVSYPQAARQAGEQGHPVERELALLVTHGVLHLLGHDHLKKTETRAMKALEARILSELS